MNEVLAQQSREYSSDPYQSTAHLAISKLMFLPFKRYAKFSGRSSRAEYWSFVLSNIAILIALVAIAAILLSTLGEGSEIISVIPAMIYILAMIIPILAVAFRRLHDQDRSAWFLLVILIPLVGGVIWFALTCIPGTQGDNRYGPNPLEPVKAA